MNYIAVPKQTMRIQIENFRCYENKTFDFGDDGQVLLTGPSGEGKTTILMAISFALFGNGRKVVTQGKTSCRVALEFEDMKIVRTKSPNRLVLNDALEDAAAQEVINRRFGTNFDVTGYVEQFGIKSFILMSPSDKLEFLEKHAFEGTDLGEIKKRNRIHIAKCKEDLTVAATELRMAGQALSEMTVPTKVEFPLAHKGSRNTAISNEQIKRKNCATRTRKAERKKSALEKEVHDIQILGAKLAGIQENSDYITSKITETNNKIDELTQKFQGAEQVTANERRLERLLARRELTALETHHDENVSRLEEMRLDEKKTLTDEIQEYEKELWQEHGPKQVGYDITDLETCLEDLEKIAALKESRAQNSVDPVKHEKHKEELTESESSLATAKTKLDKAELQKQLYSCPTCSAKLRFSDNSLVLSGESDIEIEIDVDTISDEIQALESVVRKLRKLIPIEEQKIAQDAKDKKTLESISSVYDEVPKISDVKEDLAYLRRYKQEQRDLEKKLEEARAKLKREVYSVSLNNFETSVAEAALRIEEMSSIADGFDGALDEEAVREEIATQKGYMSALDTANHEHKQLMDELNIRAHASWQAQDDHVKVYGVVRDETSLACEVEVLAEAVEAERISGESHDSNLKRIDEWQLYEQAYANYEREAARVEEYKIKEREAKNRYAAATGLRERISKAEAVSMANIVDSINTHARIYTDAFFPDNPICIQLQAFKENKKKEVKPSINLAIDYKGLECDMTMLSGGEQSRVVLAYALALAEMFSTPLMLLDECTSSLDQELTSVVFDAIRTNFNGRMTLIIAHQIIQGTFDKVIQLGVT